MNGYVRSSIKEIDNRDGGETWIHLSRGDIDPDILEISLDEALEILNSFIINQDIEGVNEPDFTESKRKDVQKIYDFVMEEIVSRDFDLDGDRIVHPKP